MPPTQGRGATRPASLAAVGPRATGLRSHAALPAEERSAAAPSVQPCVRETRKRSEDIPTRMVPNCERGAIVWLKCSLPSGIGEGTNIQTSKLKRANANFEFHASISRSLQNLF